MTHKKLTGVVFDLDGTLVDSAPDIRNALNIFLKNRGRRAITLDETKAALGDGALKLVERILCLTGDCPADIIPDVQDYIAIYRDVPGDPAQIFPGVVDVLSNLQHKGIALGVCTNKPESATLKLLDAIDLSRYFGAVAGGDTYMVHKPHPDHLRGVIEQLGVPLEGCVMVGDSPNDLVPAHRLNIPCILVDYGYGEDVSALPAEAVIKQMNELPATLVQLGYSF